ncbi:hypothetical protein CP03DC35_0721B, partial [Chlamydia psittaci 03DC35]
SVT